MPNQEQNLKLTINGCIRPAKIELRGRIQDSATAERGEDILAGIEKLLQKHRLKIQDIDEIAAPAFCDKGSYTGHRAAIAIVNALNFGLGKDIIIAPKYGQEPKITLKASSKK